MLIFTFKVENMDQMAFQLDTPIKDFTTMWPELRPSLQESVIQQMSSEGGRGPHGEYQELSPEYAKRKGKRFPGAPILQGSGAMMDSFMGSAGFHWLAEPMRMEFGSDIPYSRYHQTGTRKMPARRIFDLTDQDLAGIRSAAANWIAAQYRAAGFRVIGQAYGPAEGASITRPEASALGKEYFRMGGSPI